MGKDLKGKELGRGLAQEKSGLYVARFVDRFGKRQCKRSKKLQDAKKWLADSIYCNESSNPLFPQQMTVDGWFEQWKEMKKGSVAIGTFDTYVIRYITSIKPVIGDMKICEVKPFHCHMILNKMVEAGYCNGTIKQTRIVLHLLFDDARDNDVITSNPMKKSYKCEGGKPKKAREPLTERELKLFFEGIKGHRFEIQYRFALLTGLRVGELVALQGRNICLEKKCLYVRQSATYKKQGWRFGAPKSQAGLRTIPLTDEAIRLLEMQREKNRNLKVIPIEFADYVFIDEEGLIKPNSYNAALEKNICRHIGIRKISMHILRHTFATLCAKNGMPPKTLQTILGHSSIRMSMDYYVHTYEEEKASEMEKVSAFLSAI